MSAVTNNAEGGTNGTAVTTVNSGGASGTAFTGTSATGGSALTYDSGVSAHGLLSYKHALVSGAFTTFYQYTITATGTLVLRVYVYLDTLPGAAIRVVDIRTGSASVLRFQTNASNQFEIQEGGGSTTLTTGVFSAATWYRYEVNISNISATVGAYTASIYQLDQIATFGSVSTSTGNLGATNITVINVGSTATSTASSVLHTDDYAHDPAGTAFFGPVQSALVAAARTIRRVPLFRKRRTVLAFPPPPQTVAVPTTPLGARHTDPRVRPITPSRRSRSREQLPQNLIYNAGFETGVLSGNSIPFGFGYGTLAYFGCPLAIDTVTVHTGTYSVQGITNSASNAQGFYALASANAQAVPTQPLYLYAGTPIAAGFWFNGPNGVQWHVAYRAQSPANESLGAANFTSTGSWQWVQLATVLLDQNYSTVGVECRLLAAASGVTFNADDIAFWLPSGYPQQNSAPNMVWRATQRVDRSRVVRNRRARLTTVVPAQAVPPLLARREPRRPMPPRRARRAVGPFLVNVLPPAFIRQAVGRKVRWITAKIRRPAPTQWPQSVYIPPPPFEWEGEWLIGIVDREWIVGNPDIDPSGLK